MRFGDPSRYPTSSLRRATERCLSPATSSTVESGKIVELVKLGPIPRELIAKELSLDKASGRLQRVLSLSERGWLRPTGTRAVSWELTDEGRDELRRRTAP